MFRVFLKAGLTRFGGFNAPVFVAALLLLFSDRLGVLLGTVVRFSHDPTEQPGKNRMGWANYTIQYIYVPSFYFFQLLGII